MASDEDDQLSLFLLQSDPVEEGQEPEPAVTSDAILPRLTLRAALAPSQYRALRSGSSRLSAVVLRAPSVEWVPPLLRAAMAARSWDRTLAPTDTRPARKEEAARGIVDALTAGGRVLGVSHDPGRFLPASLVSAADLTVEVAPPNRKVVADAIYAVTGKRARTLPSAPSLGLDYNDIVNAIRPGSTPAACVRRLAAARVSKAVADPSLSSVPLLDRLHGYGAAMDWCTALVADLDDWRRGCAPFPPNCRAVLSGPPGTGKTTLVRSLARTARLPLVATSVGQWFADTSGNLDGVIKEIARIWDAARALGTAVVLIDELDALPNRATMDPRGRDWWTPVVNFVLTCLDGANSGTTRNLIIVGTTNHARQIDAALLRPGRLERVIHVGHPETASEREKIFRTLLDGQLEGQDLSAAANASDGMSGADIMGVVRDARKRARLAGRELSPADLLTQLLPPSTLSKADMRRCAVHEAGHAVAAHALAFPVEAVNLLHRSGQGGEVSYETARMPRLPTRADLESWVTSLLCGGAAEELLLGERSTGQGGSDASDISQATGVLAGIHASYGLGGTLSYRSASRDASKLLGGDAELSRRVEADMARLQSAAMDLLREWRPAVEWLAGTLAKVGFMTGTEVGAGLARFGHARASHPGAAQGKGQRGDAPEDCSDAAPALPRARLRTRILTVPTTGPCADASGGARNPPAGRCTTCKRRTRPRHAAAPRGARPGRAARQRSAAATFDGAPRDRRGTRRMIRRVLPARPWATAGRNTRTDRNSR